MKAEKVIGIAACAFACVTSSAFANTTNGWFGVTADTAIRASNCEANGAAVTVEGSRIVLDNDKDTALVITNFTGDTTSDGIVKISATALLTPNSASDLDSAVTDGAKAGFAVAVANNETNFYGYANGSWHVLSGVTPGDGETTFSMILNYRDGNVSFYVGDTLLSSADTLTLAGAATGLNAIDAYGTGSITSITGEYEVAAAAYKNKKYGSIDEAVEAVEAAGDSASTVTTYDESGAAENPKATNGMPTWVCKALDIATNDGAAKPAVVPSGADTSTSAITLKLNYDPTRDGAAKAAGVLKFKVGDGDPQNSDNIQIPLGSGTGAYQIKVVID